MGFYSIKVGNDKLLNEIYKNLAISKPITKDFFGIEVTDLTTYYHNNIQHGVVRFGHLCHWRFLELKKGEFFWDDLDEQVNIAEQNGKKIMIKFGQAPDWATGGIRTGSIGWYYNSNPNFSDTDWQDYIRAVVGRYAGRVAFWEIWNEPNLVDQFWDGTPERMAELTVMAHDIIREIDPSSKIISASCTGISGVDFFDKYIKHVTKHIDIVGVHLYNYPKQPEEMIDLANKYKEIMEKYGVGSLPLFNTECTWHSFYDEEVLMEPPSSIDYSVYMSESLGTSYLTRMYLSNLVAGVESLVFYGIDQFWSAIRIVKEEGGSVLTEAGHAFARLTDWLVGARVKDFGRVMGGIYALNMIYPDNTQGYILWVADDSVRNHIILDPALGAYQAEYVNGTSINLNATKKITLSRYPVRIKCLNGFKSDLLKSDTSRSDMYPYRMYAWDSPYYLQNQEMFDVDVLITGGKDVSIRYTRKDTWGWFNAGISSGMIMLSPNDKLEISFTDPPTIDIIPR